MTASRAWADTRAIVKKRRKRHPARASRGGRRRRPSPAPCPPRADSRGFAMKIVHSTAATAAILALACMAGAESVAVGTARAERGQTSTGYIEVPAGADPATSIPVVVVNGARPGPVLAIVSGA